MQQNWTFKPLNGDRQLPLFSIVRGMIIQKSVQSTGRNHNINFMLSCQIHSYRILTHNLEWEVQKVKKIWTTNFYVETIKFSHLE